MPSTETCSERKSSRSTAESPTESAVSSSTCTVRACGRRAREQLIALDLIREWKARRFVDEPGHERKIEKSCREAAVGRDHAIARVEGAPLETDRFAARAIR